MMRAVWKFVAKAIPRLSIFRQLKRGIPANAAAEIEDLRESVRRGFAGFEANSNFLTDEEIEAIRSAFDVPRVTRGLRAANR